MKKAKTLLFALVTMALLAVPAAALSVPESAIMWLPEGEWPYAYFKELNWVAYFRNIRDCNTGEFVKEYTLTGSVYEGMFTVYSTETKKYGFLDTSGKLVVPCEYSLVKPFSEGMARVGSGLYNTKYGYVDKTGKLAIPLEYDSAESFSEGLAAVGMMDENYHWKYGFIDKTGKVVVPIIYDKVGTFSEGLADVWMKVETENGPEERFGYINTQGEIVLPIKYLGSLLSDAFSFSEGMAIVGMYDEKGNFDSGYIDRTGKLVISLQNYGSDPTYERMGMPFHEGVAAIRTDEGWGVIDKTGKVICPMQFEYPASATGFTTRKMRFYDGMAIVSKRGADGKYKFGCIDTTGKIVIPLEYDDMGEYFFCGLLRVAKNGRSGYIDKSGNPAVPIEYESSWYVIHDENHYNEKNGSFNISESDAFYVRRDGYYGIFTPDDIEGVVSSASGSDTAPAPDSAPASPEKPAVILTNQNLTVNGEAKNTEIYNIDGSNYFKLRDMAALLNGTSSQFSVAFDSASNTIVVKTGEAYTSVGGELATGTDKSASAVASEQSVEINGAKVELTAFNIGGNNFFKLRELGEALGFDVDYDSATATMIVKSK